MKFVYYNMERNKKIKILGIAFLGVSLVSTILGIDMGTAYSTFAIIGTLGAAVSSIILLGTRTMYSDNFSKHTWIELEESPESKEAGQVFKVLNIPQSTHKLGNVTTIAVFEKTKRGYEKVIAETYFNDEGDVTIEIASELFIGKYIIK